MNTCLLASGLTTINAPRIYIVNRVLRLTLATIAGGLTMFAPSAFAKSSEMSGFRFQTCDAKWCFDLKSERAAVSQIDFGFTTTTPVTMKLTDLSGKMIRELSGTTASYFPLISTVTLEDEINGKTFMISLRTNRIQEFASEVHK